MRDGQKTRKQGKGLETHITILSEYAYLRKKSCQITWNFHKIIVYLQTKIAYLRKKSKQNGDKKGYSSKETH